MSEPTEIVQRVTRAMHCSKCGVEAAAACDCGAPYLPATARAAKAVAAHPEKSDRSIAAEIGVSAPTVGKARKATVKDFTVEPRVGLDGRVRHLPKTKQNDDDDEDMPTEAEAEESRVAEPDEIKSNFLDTIDRHAAVVRAYKKVFAVAALNQVQKDEISAAIRKLITKWTSLDRTLAAAPVENAPPPDSEEKKLNAIGKPISPLYDPKYKRRTPLTSINRLRAPFQVSLTAREAEAKREAEKAAALADAHVKDFYALDDGIPESLRRTATT